MDDHGQDVGIGEEKQGDGRADDGDRRGSRPRRTGKAGGGSSGSDRSKAVKSPKPLGEPGDPENPVEQPRVVESNLRREKDPLSATLAGLGASTVEPPRVAAPNAPEVHILGEIVSGRDFGTGVSCRWRLEHGKHWSVLEGDPNGFTQTAYINDQSEEAPWNHPIDVHYQSTSIQGWPKLICQVQRLDEYGRVSVVGYGFVHIPCVPGFYDLDVPCWRPTGTQQEELMAFFLGNTPQLLDDDLVYQRAITERLKIITAASGRVNVQISVLTRHLDHHQIDRP